MTDDTWNHPDGDFADEPTDPGIQAPDSMRPPSVNPQVQPPVPTQGQQQGQAPKGAQPQEQQGSGSITNLGFRPQTGAFGAVNGPPSTADQANPFGAPGSTPNYSQHGSQASFQGQPGAGSGGFTPQVKDPSGAFNTSTGEFSTPQNNTGSFAPPKPGPANAPSASGSFAPPMTGGFQAVPGQQPDQAPSHSVPGQTGPNPGVVGPGNVQPGPSGQFQSVASGQSGAFQNVPGATGQFQAPVGQPLQIGEMQDGPPEPTLKVRATFAVGGLFMGAIVGLALGLLNSVVEGVGVLDGMSVTLQISLWFGGTIALICAWKPEKVWETLDGYGFFD